MRTAAGAVLALALSAGVGFAETRLLHLPGFTSFLAGAANGLALSLQPRKRPPWEA